MDLDLDPHDDADPFFESDDEDEDLLRKEVSHFLYSLNGSTFPDGKSGISRGGNSLDFPTFFLPFRIWLSLDGMVGAYAPGPWWRLVWFKGSSLIELRDLLALISCGSDALMLVERDSLIEMLEEPVDDEGVSADDDDDDGRDDDGTIDVNLLDDEDPILLE